MITYHNHQHLSGTVADAIYQSAKSIVPVGSSVILFGSRARGDASADSDWDLLILLNKDHLEVSDHDRYAYPFWELGWTTGAMIHPIIYTRTEWEKRRGGAFYENVQKDGIVLC